MLDKNTIMSWSYLLFGVSLDRCATTERTTRSEFRWMLCFCFVDFVLPKMRNDSSMFDERFFDVFLKIEHSRKQEKK